MLELVDPELGQEFSIEEATMMLNVALMCTNSAPTLRPTMSQVVSMLQGQTDVRDLVSDPGFSTGDSKFKAIRKHFWESHSVSHSLTTSGVCSHSFTSKLDSEENEIIRTNDESSISL